MATPAERRLRAIELLSHVGLPTDRLDARAGEFSGGERQRLAIARALAVRPRLLILDEAFSGLDVETRTRITSLLMTLQREQDLALLCISHDLDFLAEFAPEIAVMRKGAIVEQGATVRRYIPEAVPRENPERAPRAQGRPFDRAQGGGGMSMLRFVLRRLAYGALITLGVSVLTFTMLELAPGEFFDDLKLDATVTAGTVESLRQAHGLTESAPVRFARWLGSVARGDFGLSLAHRRAGCATAVGARAEHARPHGAGAVHHVADRAAGRSVGGA